MRATAVLRDLEVFDDRYWEAYELMIKTIKRKRGWLPYYVLTCNG